MFSTGTVAQSCTLPYRGFVIRGPPRRLQARAMNAKVCRLQVGDTARYGRLQICATAGAAAACVNLFGQCTVWRMIPFGRTRFRGAWVGFLMAASATAGDWPSFRGPTGNGVAQEAKAPLHWGPGKNVRWKVPLPGPGNSSPIVSHGHVFVTFAEDDGKKRNLYCFDRRSGEKHWVRTVEFPMPTRVIACDPTTGSLLWSCAGLANEKADLVYASPVVSGGIGVAFTG